MKFRGKSRVGASTHPTGLELIDRAEAIVGIRKGLDSLEKREGISADEAIRSLRKKHKIGNSG